jgi:hypothetical protein
MNIETPDITSQLNALEINHNENEEESPRWNDRHELTLKMWAEEALCLRKMHEIEHRRYAARNLQLTIPVIIMSTLTGVANFSLSSFSEVWRERIPVIIGSVNILAGMITTISQYLRVSETSEGHRVASIAYGKLNRNIQSELTLPRGERSASGLPFFRLCRAEMDRLEEQSPEILPCAVAVFIGKYGLDIKQYSISIPSNMQLSPVEICTKDMSDIQRRRNTTPPSTVSSGSSKGGIHLGSLNPIPRILKITRQLSSEEKEEEPGIELAQV